MGTPVLIDATGHLRESEISYFALDSGPKAGPYLVGGNIFCLGNNPYPTAPPNTFLEMFVSTDGGLTFAESDATNHITAHDRLATTAPPDNGEWRMYDSVLVGTTIYVLYIKTNATLAIVAFDTTANAGLGAWGTIWSGGPTMAVEPVLYLQYDQQGTQLVVVYQTGPGNDINVRTVSLAGTWSAATLVQAFGGVGTIAQLTGIASGWNGATYFTQVFFRTTPTSSSREFRHRSVSSALAIGASQLLGSFSSAGGTGVDLSMGTPMSASALNGFKVMAVIWANEQDGATPFSIFRSYEASSGATPVWTAADIFTETVVTKNFTAIGVAAQTDGTIQLVYSTNNFNYQTRTLVAGAWSAENLFLDITTGPDFNIAQNQISMNAAGFVLTYGLDGNSDGTPLDPPLNKEVFQLNVFFLGEGAPAPLAIICDNPPPGIAGVAYSHFFPASGGVPPYTFALHAGVLPTGLTLNAATGEISGIPTEGGVFPITIRVTDSAATTADVECVLTIKGRCLQ